MRATQEKLILPERQKIEIDPSGVIFFDADKTLIDREKQLIIEQNGVEHSIRAETYSYILAAQELVRTNSFSPLDDFDAILTRFNNSPSRYEDLIAAVFGRHLEAEEFEKFKYVHTKISNNDEFLGYLQEVPSANRFVGLVVGFSEYGTLIVTNNTTTNIERYTDQVGIEPLHIISAYEGKPKPHHRSGIDAFYKVLTEYCQKLPSEISDEEISSLVQKFIKQEHWYIGDSKKSDGGFVDSINRAINNSHMIKFMKLKYSDTGDTTNKFFLELANQMEARNRPKVGFIHINSELEENAFRSETDDNPTITIRDFNDLDATLPQQYSDHPTVVHNNRPYVLACGVLSLEKAGDDNLSVTVNIRNTGLTGGVGGKPNNISDKNSPSGTKPELLKIALLRESYEEVGHNNPREFLIELRNNIQRKSDKLSSDNSYDNYRAKDTILTRKIDELLKDDLSTGEETNNTILGFLQDPKNEFLLNKSIEADRFDDFYTNKIGGVYYRVSTHALPHINSFVGKEKKMFLDLSANDELKGVVLNIPVNCFKEDGSFDLGLLKQSLSEEDYNTIVGMLGDNKIHFSKETYTQLQHLVRLEKLKYSTKTINQI